MPARRTVLLALAVSALPVGAVRAAERALYTQQVFETAQRAGKPILVEITAPWCSTCRAQKPILGELAAQPRFRDLVVLEIDFDHQKSVVRAFGATMQSTLIGFRGGEEVSRSVGDTAPASIAALLDKTL